MKLAPLLHRIAVHSLLASASLSFSTACVATSPIEHDLQQGERGTSRGSGYPINVVVAVNGAAVAGAAVTVKSSKNKTMIKTTDAGGFASFTLEAGDYIVTVTSDIGSASTTMHVVASTTPLIVPLVLTTAAKSRPPQNR